MLLLCAAGTLLRAAAPDCDRTCLKGALDQYLNAVVKHDPSAAGLLPGFRQTENAVVVGAGAGVWQAVTALGKVQRRYLDTESGQAGYLGLVEEKDGLAIVTLRVKVVQHKVAEAEWLIARKGDPGSNVPPVPGQAGNFFDPDNLIANPPPERVLPAGERLPREALAGIANSYFDGLSTHDGALVQAHAGCVRIENGFTVTGRPVLVTSRTSTSAGTEGSSSAKTDCTSNLQGFNIAFVAARRFPLVDEEAGVVLGMGVFIRRPGTVQRRNVLSEWFAIDHNRIRSIHAVMFYPPAEAPMPNWPPYNGNWPMTTAVTQ